MLCTICISNRELGTNIYSSVNDTSHFLDSILFCISHCLSLHFVSRKFFSKFSEHRRISMFYTIRCRVKIENHIIAVAYINGSVIVSGNITTDNIHTIVFSTTRCFDGSVTDGATTFVCVHIHSLFCLMSSKVNFVLCIINNTLIASGRQLIVIDSLVKFIVLPRQGFQFLVTHAR